MKSYPEPYDIRSGCKVGWYIYKSLEDAKACSEAAKHNAAIKWDLGYDFGYCSPGSIKELGDHTYEVCIP